MQQTLIHSILVPWRYSINSKQNLKKIYTLQLLSKAFRRPIRYPRFYKVKRHPSNEISPNFFHLLHHQIFLKDYEMKTGWHLESSKLTVSNSCTFVAPETEHLFDIDNVVKALRTESNTDIIYLDISKAFPTISHNTLQWKLSNIGISSNLPHWINYFHVNRTLQIEIVAIPSSVTLEVVFSNGLCWAHFSS